MKNTPFTKFHEEAGARMVPFAGYNMPVEYTGINDEHIAVRKKVGVFDVSHMGEFWVTGPSAMDFIQYITSNDVTVLSDGKVQYSCFPNGKGGIVDDLLVYRFNAEKYLLVVNAANIEKDWNWCVKNSSRFGIVPGRDLINASNETAQLAIQGPLALKAMQKLTSVPVEDMEYYTFKVIEFAGIKDVIFSTSGYTGAGGCEIYIKNEDGPALWKSVFEAGDEFGIRPIGLGARDTLRLEMGFCLYGNDITDDTSPIEAGLGWITKFTDSKDFIDKTFLMKQKEEGVERRLKGFIMIDRGIPRQHYEIVNVEGEIIGEVTSGTMSPMMKQGIGMAYLTKGYWKPDCEIFIRIRSKELKARVVNLPFYSKP
ncbi:MAG: glycine cleavage system protein T [Bacteroidetes bacterium GWE2_41_25]|nr:MAG: glycine cleavage system protein T [Bacteroidetes bacterium GWA2_40_15]OFX93697.1 MAG: glycine cleavage system protein T [Bacteroidetes bacterium GWC2_40_22]OFY01653.1 MAG: glycine cleavage system protein T [Bacteroidetes bacterium GWE2_41_25]OFY61124.1 MAG: glycine cleavage system protein T [Bacteroidetes bacterium GWF2_41_9]HAM09809.1 glycine cleavage system aminomethyltransferase GcvT [Bacteroidales bacterium]